MPEKTIREMSEQERKRHSLASRVFHSTIIGSIILGITALLIGLGMFSYSLVDQYISEGFSLSENALHILERTVDIEPLSEAVMQEYRALRAADENTAYDQERFSSFAEREDYRTICSVMSEYLNFDQVEFVYLAMYDENTSSMVYIADPDDSEEHMMPGEWESVSKEGMQRFLNWDGTGRLYEIDKTEKYGWLCTTGVPFRGSDGEIKAFVLTDVSLANVVNGMKSFFWQYTAGVFLIMNLFGYLLIQRMKKTLVGPINAISQAAQDYVKDRREGNDVEDHFSSLNIKTGDEIENLSLVMSDMERDLAEHEEDLTRVTAEKERINTELSLANRIQTDMLPNIYPAFPEYPEFDIYAYSKPAREVGGDFYDYFLIDQDHLCMVMADVSGKGIPAALFMMASKIILSNNAMMNIRPSEILKNTNDLICSNNREEMFVTVWLGILEISTGKITAANAGHEYPAVMHENGRFGLIRDKHGFVIGGVSGLEYSDYEIDMKPGSKLFLYTDGVTEAADAASELFGTDRMLDALNSEPDADAMKLIKNIHDSISGFCGDTEQSDDITMLCLEYKGKEEMRDESEPHRQK
ncbi:MAG: serine/threonine-protein phosphatase [Solobacterium sp.]|nr:serine/threonine-protein phosphatase [Solobacterium sp.]